jgi:hypothetical protein
LLVGEVGWIGQVWLVDYLIDFLVGLCWFDQLIGYVRLAQLH